MVPVAWARVTVAAGSSTQSWMSQESPVPQVAAPLCSARTSRLLTPEATVKLWVNLAGDTVPRVVLTLV